MNVPLPRAAIKRIMFAAGATRVSPDAIDALNRYLVEQGTAATKHALTVASHAGRQTIKADDVQRATQQ